MLRRVRAAATRWCSQVSTSRSMLILSESDVRQCLDMRSCIAINRTALIAMATGDAVVPTRLSIPFPSTASSTLCSTTTATATTTAAADCTLFKPAAFVPVKNAEAPKAHGVQPAVGLKVVSVRASNPSMGLPLVPATILHLNPDTGIVEAVVAGTHLTAMRTAAGSALAVHAYYKSLSIEHVVVFGAGVQAEQHVVALHAIHNCTIPTGGGTSMPSWDNAPPRPIPLVTLINRDGTKAAALATRLMDAHHVDQCDVIAWHPTAGIQNAMRTASVIVTCTNAATPLWNDDDMNIPDTCIITGIGSYTPDMQEVPTATVNQCAHVWMDTPEARTVGDLKHLDANDATLPRPRLLGHVLNAPAANGGSVNDTVAVVAQGRCFYKAVGTAIQDVVTAAHVVERARHLGLGTTVDMS